jgi:hypothetical protein
LTTAQRQAFILGAMYIDWSGLKVAAIALQSVRQAAIYASSDLPADEQQRFVERVNKRAYRERWLANVHAMSKPRDNGAMPLSKPVQTGSDALEIALQRDERETRASLSKYARKVSKTAAASPDIEQAPLVHKVAQTAGIVHKWDQKTGAPNVMVNIALLGIDPGDVEVSEG